MPIPTILPMMAPMARDGMKRPAGIFKPKVKMVKIILRTSASANFHIAE